MHFVDPDEDESHRAQLLDGNLCQTRNAAIPLCTLYLPTLVY